MKKATTTYLFHIVGCDGDCDYDGSVGVVAIATGYVVVRMQPVQDRRKRINHCCRPLDVCVVDVARNFRDRNLNYCYCHRCCVTTTNVDFHHQTWVPTRLYRCLRKYKSKIIYCFDKHFLAFIYLIMIKFYTHRYYMVYGIKIDTLVL